MRGIDGVRLAQMNFDKVKERGVLAVFSVLFFVCVLVGLIAAYESVNVALATPEELKLWPFGWEGGGFKYESAEVYLGRGIFQSYIFVKEMIIGLYFYIKRLRFAGVDVLISPL